MKSFFIHIKSYMCGAILKDLKMGKVICIEISVMNSRRYHKYLRNSQQKCITLFTSYLLPVKLFSGSHAVLAISFTLKYSVLNLHQIEKITTQEARIHRVIKEKYF